MTFIHELIALTVLFHKYPEALLCIAVFFMLRVFALTDLSITGMCAHLEYAEQISAVLKFIECTCLFIVKSASNAVVARVLLYRCYPCT
jgi:hypothetical protein